MYQMSVCNVLAVARSDELTEIYQLLFSLTELYSEFQLIV